MEQFTNYLCNKLKKDHDPSKILKKEGKRVLVRIYAACAHDEVATENVFTDLLKGQLPDKGTFAALKKVLYEDWEKGGAAKKRRKDTKIGDGQHLTYGTTYVMDERRIKGWKEQEMVIGGTEE